MIYCTWTRIIATSKILPTEETEISRGVGSLQETVNLTAETGKCTLKTMLLVVEKEPGLLTIKTTWDDEMHVLTNVEISREEMAVLFNKINLTIQKQQKKTNKQFQFNRNNQKKAIEIDH